MSNIARESLYESFALDEQDKRLEEFYQDEKERGPVEAWQEFCFILERSGYPLPRPNSAWDLDKDRRDAFFELLLVPQYGYQAWLDKRFEEYCEALESGPEWEPEV